MKQIKIVIISILLNSCITNRVVEKEFTNPKFSYNGKEEEVFSVEKNRGKDPLLSLYVSDKSINCSKQFEGYVRCLATIDLDSSGMVNNVSLTDYNPYIEEIEKCIIEAIYQAKFTPAKQGQTSIPITFSILLYVDLYNASH